MPKNLKCPKCGAKAGIIKIFYGMPPLDIQEKERRGELVCFGCIISEDDPKWYCKECHHSWGHVDNINR